MEYLWKETEELGDKERFLLYALHTFLEGNKEEGVGVGIHYRHGISWEKRCRFKIMKSLIKNYFIYLFIYFNVSSRWSSGSGIGIPFASLCLKVKVTQSCPTLCDPVDYTVHGILQARILEWVAFPFSRGSSQPRN